MNSTSHDWRYRRLARARRRLTLLAMEEKLGMFEFLLPRKHVVVLRNHAGAAAGTKGAQQIFTYLNSWLIDEMKSVLD